MQITSVYHRPHFYAPSATDFALCNNFGGKCLNDPPNSLNSKKLLHS